MEPRPDLESLCCINPECKQYGEPGAGNLRVRKVYGRDQIRYLRCGACGAEFSERKGTALFNLKIRERKAASIIEHLDRGCGVVAPAELVGVAKDTVSRLRRVTGQSRRAIQDRLIRNLRPAALQFDEKWSYTAKKQKHITAEDDPTQVGDHWDVNCLDPTTKLLITLVPGPRTEATIHQAVADAASRLAAGAPPPAIFTDGEPAYPEAVLEVFGYHYPVPRTGQPGRPPKPKIRVPHQLVYAQVIKHQRRGKVTSVQIRPSFGKGKLPAVVAALGWTQANLSAIEQFNLTDRTRNARKTRKTLRFSKRTRCHDWMSWISAVWYNFHHVHRSLRRPADDGQWEKRTPAMAAGLVDHRFSTLELLRLCPVGLG